MMYPSKDLPLYFFYHNINYESKRYGVLVLIQRKNDSVVFVWHFRNYDCCVLDNQITQKGSLSG